MTRIFYFLFASLFSLSSFCQLPQLSMVQVATGFSNPVDIKNCGDDRIFIVEQAGYIRIMNKQGNIRPTAFLDIRTRVNSSGGEQGLLSVAFSPNYKQDGFLYVNYINGSGNGSTRISRFQVSPTDSNIADQATEKILLTIPQPAGNHNGGILQFGNDGYLYDAQGDGGGSGDPSNNAQNTNTYHGKILRLDVSNPDTTYTIPATNPFYGQSGKLGEIWAYGVRNPWRCSFDRITHDFWMADVGQGLYEEVDFQSASSTGGENYGWRCYEGLHPYGSCTPPSVFPVSEYTHAYGGCSITGGYVYRGTQHARLWGLYLFTDFCSGRIWSIKQTSPNVFDTDTFQTFLTNQYSTFGEDNNGEMYLAARGQGRIYRITETSDCKPVAFISMSDTITGCIPVTIKALRGDSLNYQWLNESGEINNATSTLLQVSESGWYRVKTAKAEAGCETISDSVYVEVLDSAILSIPIPLPSYCINQDTALLPNISPVDGVYTGTGVAGSTIDLQRTGVGITPVTYTYINSSGCRSSITLSLQVNDTSTLTELISDTSVCANSGSLALATFINPGGGIYSGIGVSEDSIFDYPIAGNYPLQYQYYNGLCTSSASVNIEVTESTLLTKNIPVITYCLDIPAFSLEGLVTPAGGTYSGSGVSDNSFLTAAAGPGTSTIYYTYTNEQGCTSMDTFTLEVDICTGIENTRGSLAFAMFPNPNNGLFNIAIEPANPEQVTVSIIDGLGRTCFERETQPANNTARLAINATGLPKGIYSVRVKSKNETAVKRLVIN